MSRVSRRLVRASLLVCPLILTACGGGGSSAPATVSSSSGTSSSGTSSSGTSSGGAPTATSVTAASDTAVNNSMCSTSNLGGYYWEIGDRNGALASGSVGTDSQNSPVTVGTKVSIASASKWIYGAYIAQLRSSTGGLTAQDIDFLHFTSGYSNMGTVIASSECPDPATGSNSVNVCLSQTNPHDGQLYSWQDPTTIGKFDYDSGHLENHASLYGGLGDVPNGTLGTTIGQALGTNIDFLYTEPLMAGGIFTNASTYAQVLRNILTGALDMNALLGTSPVCTRPSAPGCNAVFSPIPEAWHYSMAHWVEDDPATNGDGAFSSPGAFGFYPWIDATRNYYGIISRQATQIGGGEQAGYTSAQCGRLIRRAFMTGVQQQGQLPN